MRLTVLSLIFAACAACGIYLREWSAVAGYSCAMLLCMIGLRLERINYNVHALRKLMEERDGRT